VILLMRAKTSSNRLLFHSSLLLVVIVRWSLRSIFSFLRVFAVFVTFLWICFNKQFGWMIWKIRCNIEILNSDLLNIDLNLILLCWISFLKFCSVFDYFSVWFHNVRLKLNETNLSMFDVDGTEIRLWTFNRLKLNES
jgi:hypothetical protein